MTWGHAQEVREKLPSFSATTLPPMQRIPVMLLSIGALIALAAAVKVAAASAPEVSASESTGFFSSIGDFFGELWQLVCLHVLAASLFFGGCAVLCSIYGMSVLKIIGNGAMVFV